MRRKTTAPVEKILLRVAIYIRVSTDKQVKDGDSMRDQLATGQKYIDSHENMILVDTYIDDGISGQKLKRDDFQRLIDDVRAGRIDLIIFTRLDRWFRNLRHYLNTQDILDKHGVSWTAIEQPYFDTSTPHGRAFVNNSMIWAELEAQNDSDRILGVFDDKVDNGEVLSGSTPLGYTIVNKHLVPDDDAPTAVLSSNTTARPKLEHDTPVPWRASSDLSVLLPVSKICSQIRNTSVSFVTIKIIVLLSSTVTFSLMCRDFSKSTSRAGKSTIIFSVVSLSVMTVTIS